MAPSPQRAELEPVITADTAPSTAASAQHAAMAALLDEIRALLHADTAALLLVDPSGRMLVPELYSGMPGSARAAMSIPVGRGFAGSVAGSRRPRALEEVSPVTVLNPLLIQRGLHGLLGVPVLDGEELLGVVHVGSVAPRRFDAEDIVLLTRAAQRLAVAIRDRRAVEQHTAALVLQRSLLPALLPDVPGLDMAARYVPADGEVGGDWYDVLCLPDERVGVVMGDVLGHGLAASVVMGRLRSALRAYALEHEDPAEVLARLDRKISYFERGAMATVLYALAEPPYDRFRISSAGHLAPLLSRPGAATAAVAVRPDPPLGVHWTGRRHATTVAVPPGAALCLYTDGLVERRPSAAGGAEEDIDAGIARLAACLTAGDPDDMCTTAVSRLLGDGPAEDDVALLVLRRAAD